MLEIDLHGQNSFEARLNIQIFLKECIIRKIKIARISHGYGEGILKNVLVEELNKSKYIEKYYLAHPFDGGGGITIIEFKR